MQLKPLCITAFFVFAVSGFVSGQIEEVIKDSYGRQLILHGLNTSGGAKHDPNHLPWIQESDVEHEHTQFGFDAVRFLIFWGAIEPQRDSFDEAYLQKVKERVNWYTSRHMYVILDMHQDVYGYGVGDNGAPVWAGAKTIIKNLIPDKWPWWMQNLEPKVVQSYVHFFKYKKHKDLQQHYIICWQKVAAMFRDNPYVIGYDLMNEPHGGRIVKTLAGGFERRQLSAFYKRLIPGIRAVDTLHYIFFEPRSFGVNFGMKAHLPAVNDSKAGNARLVYSPHFYLRFVDIGGDYNAKSVKEMGTWFSHRDAELKKHHSAMLVGEFGLSPQKKDFDIYLRDFQKNADQRMASWTYWSNDHGSWSPLKADGTPSPILYQLLRVYPQATAGKLYSYSYSPADKVFEMEFVTDSTIQMPTEIAVPALLYPNGYSLSVSGNVTWHSTKDAVTNTLSIYTKENAVRVKIHIEPVAAK